MLSSVNVLRHWPAAMTTFVGHCSNDIKNDIKNDTMFILLIAVMYLSDASLQW
jgi:hypothetical protein